MSSLPEISGATADLKAEYFTLKSIPSEEQTPTHRQRQGALYAELARRAATPPQGYALPRAAADWVRRGEDAGWQYLVQWQPDSDGTPYVTVQVGRAVLKTERNAFTSQGWHGSYWKYTATWNTRNVARTAPVGTLTLFRGVGGVSPQNPVFHTTTVRAVAEMMYTHAVPVRER